jgi:hypothetical protein
VSRPASGAQKKISQFSMIMAAPALVINCVSAENGPEVGGFAANSSRASQKVGVFAATYRKTYHRANCSPRRERLSFP